MSTLDKALEKVLKEARERMDENFKEIRTESEKLEASITKLESKFLRVKEKENRFYNQQA